MIVKHFAGGRFEEAGSYARAKRVGPFVYVAGTTAIEPSGRLHAPGDAYAQTPFILGRVEEALREVGAQMRHVMRTRAYLTGAGGGVHPCTRHVFRGIHSVLTGVEAGLTQPGMMVEIDVDGIVHDDDGTIAF